MRNAARESRASEASAAPRESRIDGGPDFDHSYLLPDLDRLADAFRLIYYDQRDVGDLRKVCSPRMSLSNPTSTISTR